MAKGEKNGSAAGIKEGDVPTGCLWVLGVQATTTPAISRPLRQTDFASLLFDRWQGIITILQALPGSRCAEVSLIFR